MSISINPRLKLASKPTDARRYVLQLFDIVLAIAQAVETKDKKLFALQITRLLKLVISIIAATTTNKWFQRDGTDEDSNDPIDDIVASTFDRVLTLEVASVMQIRQRLATDFKIVAGHDCQFTHEGTCSITCAAKNDLTCRHA